MANIPPSDPRRYNAQSRAQAPRGYTTQGQPMNVRRSAVSNQPGRVTNERIRPMTGTQNSNVRQLNVNDARTRVMQLRSGVSGADPRDRARDAARKKAQKRTQTHDFLLGLIVGLAIFGTAAIFVCNALVNIFL